MASMLPERWNKLEEVFQTAADLPEEQRPGYLKDACGDDQELRREVEELLTASTLDLIRDAIESTSDLMAAEADQDPLVGSLLGSYRMMSLIGRGGMGVVYRAVRDDDQFHREVAIKVIPRMLAGPEAIGRFRSERQILADLDHPNIARLLDGGTSDGVPYLVMEFVEGVPITEYVKTNNLPVPDRLLLMRSVCAAVQSAHQKLVVHRDLKPANILVTPDGRVKLLDFGVAKMLAPSETDLVQTSSYLMTPDYASPEQILGQPVSTASDVYSLGVVLYEVLAGERPYRITGSGLHEAERLICQTEPRKLSELPHLPPRFRRRLSGDLDNIVQMAMRKHVERRYGSVEQFSEDLRRHMEGQPVRARADTPLYSLGKFLSRHRWPVAAGLVVAAALVTSTVVAVGQARRAEQRFAELRAFARTVLVDLHGQLRDIPGTASARRAIIANVENYLRRLVVQGAADDASLANEFATTYLRLGEIAESSTKALADFESGRALLERKRGRRAPEPDDAVLLARLHERMAGVQGELGNPAKVEQHLLAAVNLTQPPSGGRGASPEAEQVNALVHWRLAQLYRTEYHLAAAEQQARTAMSACESLRSRGIRNHELDEIQTGVRNGLAAILRRQGRWALSLEMYQKVLADAEDSAKANPGSVAGQRALARSHQIVGDMLRSTPGREAEAAVHLRAAVKIGERLAAEDSGDATSEINLGQYLATAGEELTAPAQWAESVAYLRRAAVIFQNRLATMPDNGVDQLYMALTEAALGERLGDHGQRREGVQYLRRGFHRMQALVARDPKNTTNLLELFKVQRALARQLAAQGRGGEAMRLALEVVSRAREVAAQATSGQTFTRREVPLSLLQMGQVCQILGRAEEARSWFRQTIDAWEQLNRAGIHFPELEAAMAEARVRASSVAARRVRE
ncbi:serine/threonine-protein kinase [uncultured Paludibaculum sp.]|uniref:serine/threonine-protein kinase n=1 Tax=uncultured Paludibaculum sp. TaxID=1765020 RepID=UPI002AAC35E9|nr:serine/threonine-protein kinase [uncultured Paludibaculum sp.]